MNEEANQLMSEKELQSGVVEVMKWSGWLTYHTHDSRRSNPGFPDLVGVKDSRIVFIEFKREKGKVSDEQHDWLTRLVEASEDVYLVRPSSLDAFLEILRGEYTLENLEACHWRNQPEARQEES